MSNCLSLFPPFLFLPLLLMFLKERLFILEIFLVKSDCSAHITKDQGSLYFEFVGLNTSFCHLGKMASAVQGMSECR